MPFFATRGFRVGIYRPPGITPNFHYFEFSSSTETVGMAYNQENNVATFSKPIERSWSPNFFLDHEVLHSTIPSYMEVRILSRELLLTTISPRELAERYPEYAYDAKYWKPDTVAEVLFNYWD